MYNLAKYAGVVCVVASLLLQIMIFFLRISLAAKEEMEHACKEAANLAMTFFAFSWIFSISETGNADTASLITFVALIFSVLFALWACAAFRGGLEEGVRRLHSRLRIYCAIYAMFGFAVGFLLR